MLCDSPVELFVCQCKFCGCPSEYILLSFSFPCPNCQGDDMSCCFVLLLAHMMYFFLVSCHGGDGQTAPPSLSSTNQCFVGVHMEASTVV
jgi:hypothetical protein